MNETPDKDWLEDLLKEESAYIDDAGFTARTVAQLPSRPRFRWTRRLILTLTSLMAVLVGSMALPQGQDLAIWSRVAMNTMTASPTLALAIIAAVVFSILSASLVWVAQEK